MIATYQVIQWINNIDGWESPVLSSVPMTHLQANMFGWEDV